jgi:hypothetical protein
MIFDAASRLLIEREPAALIAYLLNRPIDPTRLRPIQTELTGPSVRADSVYEFDDPPQLIHIEFEKTARPERIHPRLITYFERIYSKYGRVPQQFVIVLEGSSRLPGVFEVGRLRLAYNVIHLCDEPVDRLMQDPSLSPLAVLAHRTAQETAVSRLSDVLDHINTIADPERRRQLSVDAANFANIILDSSTILELLRGRADRRALNQIQHNDSVGEADRRQSSRHSRDLFLNLQEVSRHAGLHQRNAVLHRGPRTRPY